jgi:hypothetical protein
MGGPGSGSWQSGRSTTSDYRSLDVRKLRRYGWMTPGRAETVTWSRNGEITASIDVRSEQDRINLQYRYKRDGDWKQMDYPVSLDWTSCQMGGRRSWFLCPANGCGKRVALLYLGRSGIFACRHCYKLAYACQRETADDRAARRTNTLRKRLGWQAGILNPVGEKPKGLHWSTFERLKARHDVAALSALTGLAEQIGMMNGRLDSLRPRR